MIVGFIRRYQWTDSILESIQKGARSQQGQTSDSYASVFFFQFEVGMGTSTWLLNTDF